MSHNPRPYLFNEEGPSTVSIGEFILDGLAFGMDHSEEELLSQLNRTQRREYRQAKSEGFSPVVLIDVLTCVMVVEMRKHLNGPVSR
jgi:hypothetical protein